MFARQETLLFKMELQQCFSAKRIPIFILLTLIGIFLVVQESEVSPLVVIFLVIVAILEAQFNNIFFRSPNELEALSMFPISWTRVVFVKNIATIILTGITSIIIAMVILYFSPKALDVSIVSEALLYAATIIFPLLHIGNNESLRSPRKLAGWHLDDLVQAAGMFLFVLVLSFPYILFTTVLRLPVLNIVYSITMAWYWYKRSIPKTAFNIEQKKTELCTGL